MEGSSEKLGKYEPNAQCAPSSKLYTGETQLWHFPIPRHCTRSGGAIQILGLA